MKPRRQAVVYVPRVCHACGGAGCTRCKDSGFTRGPDSTPVELADLNAPALNWRGIQKGRA